MINEKRLTIIEANEIFIIFLFEFSAMEEKTQQEPDKKPLELMDLHDTVIETIFQSFDDKDLVNVAYTCKRLQRIIRSVLPRKYRKALKINSPKEVSLHTWENMYIMCPSIEDVVRVYSDIEIFHLDTYDSWEELYPIAKHLTQLKVLDLKIYVFGYNHIFQSAERIQQMLCIASERNLPIQRLKMDMEFGFIVNMLWMIAENLTQLKDLELIFKYEMCVGEIEDADNLRFRTLEKLSVQCARHSGEEFAAMKSIAMFTFDELIEFSLKGLHAPNNDFIDFIVRQHKLEKLILIDCTAVNVQAISEFKKKLPQLKEIVTDVDEQSKKMLEKQFGSRWSVSEHSETYANELKKAWKFMRIES